MMCSPAGSWPWCWKAATPSSYAANRRSMHEYFGAADLLLASATSIAEEH